MKIITQFFCFSVLLNVSYASSICMADCTNELTQRPPSPYEQYFCNSDNNGKTIKLKETNNFLLFILCPKTLPTSCQKFPTILNCFEVFEANSSTPIQSGYFSMQTSNGSQVLVYCNVENYIDGDSCSQVFQENNAAPSGYYKIRFSQHSLIFMYCNIEDYIDGYNCSHILQKNSSAPSGYYAIQSPNGSLISVYCNMEGSTCDDEGGWMRVGYINMSEPGATCPSGLNSYFFPNISYPLCDRPHPSNNGCNFTIFSTIGLNYSQVCGQVRGYQLGNVDGIYDNNGGSPSLEGAYIDGVSITRGSNPRHHIWTYIAGQRETGQTQEACPCNDGSTETTLQYVGDDYYCESGSPVFESYTFHYDDLLWDGKQCDYLETPCCTSPNMPWFVKSLNQSSTDDIELRLCTSEDILMKLHQ